MAESQIDKLVNYFIKNHSKGYTFSSLKIALIRQGYSRAAIARASEKATKKLAEKAPVIKEKPKIKYELIDEDNKVIHSAIKKPWWQKIFKRKV